MTAGASQTVCDCHIANPVTDETDRVKPSDEFTVNNVGLASGDTAPQTSTKDEVVSVTSPSDELSLNDLSQSSAGSTPHISPSPASAEREGAALGEKSVATYDDLPKSSQQTCEWVNCTVLKGPVKRGSLRA